MKKYIIILGIFFAGSAVAGDDIGSGIKYSDKELLGDDFVNAIVGKTISFVNGSRLTYAQDGGYKYRSNNGN